MPSAAKISVVVQGPIVGHGQPLTLQATRAVLTSVRIALPGAEIILSTWPGQADSNLDCDILVESPDPGSIVGTRATNFLANTGRQIVSSAAGLARASRPFALKLRSDTMLRNAAFAEIWDQRRIRGLQPRHLSAKVLVSAFSTYNPIRVPIPYHPSDLFQFGVTADIRRLWAVDPPTNADALCFAEGSWQRNLNCGSGAEADRPERLTPEQFLCIGFFRSRGVAAQHRGIRSANPVKLFHSEFLLVSHYMPVDPSRSGFVLPERFQSYSHEGSPLYRDDCESPLFTADGPGAARAALCRRSVGHVASAWRETRRRVRELRARAAAMRHDKDSGHVI